MTWITPFDCITSYVEMLATLPADHHGARRHLAAAHVHARAHRLRRGGGRDRGDHGRHHQERVAHLHRGLAPCSWDVCAERFRRRIIPTTREAESDLSGC